MTEPLADIAQTSANGTTRTAEPQSIPEAPELETDSPPAAPRWVKVLGIVLIVLLLAFAGLHLTRNAPTHMPGSSGAEHGMQAP